MLLGVVVLNNIWILELYRIPIDAEFSLVATSLQVDICCHQRHGVIFILHSMCMELLAINYSRNDTSIASLLPRKVTLRRVSINNICTLIPFLITSAAKHPTFLNSMISYIKKILDPAPTTSLIPKLAFSASTISLR